ncbi:hypothetical protein CWI36_0812p0020 [Hamiltosporidium magnivora]|uniref:Uncharacterized protein n=1 Tax=Hamiltosporidium magnivora TaxID=148818 RepID=A0A4Q9LB82_9MICR|nr:hypothetical protein CWI36_0812p0020 [Hamiltosporidium magnivora]
MEEIMGKLKEIEGLIDSSKKLPQGIIESLEYESKMLFTYLTLKIALGKLTNTLDIKDLERIKSLKNNFEIVKERKNEIFDEKVENDVLKLETIYFDLRSGLSQIKMPNRVGKEHYEVYTSNQNAWGHNTSFKTIQ